MVYKVTVQTVSDGVIEPTDLQRCTTEAQVNAVVAATPDILVAVAPMTEVQRRGLFHYLRAMALGTATTSVETAISAII